MPRLSGTPLPEPNVHETTYPCCGAFTHLHCLVQAARLHGRCPNCRAAIDHLPREPSVAERCQNLGVSLEFASARLPARSAAHAEVRDYATRTFSRADAPEPSEPAHVRVVCCRRLAGPEMGFTELPDSRMHWAPVPRRGPSGITRWTAVWLCMRCCNELEWERVQVPGPAPACMRCNVPMLWEVDMRQRVERWACSRCLGEGPPRALTLQTAAQPTAHATPAPPMPRPPPPRHAVADLARMPPPSLPFGEHTNSRIYVPLLLHAAGLVSHVSYVDHRGPPRLPLELGGSARSTQCQLAGLCKAGRCRNSHRHEKEC
eukprot:s1708_g20.t1